MPKFSQKSKARLETCESDLQRVLNEAVKHVDFSVQYGHRTPEEQFELYKKGRALHNGSWVRVGRTVTDKDGTIKKSKHNYLPSRAVDILPYPFNGWSDLDQFVRLKKEIFKAAEVVGVKLIWGADWDGDGNIAEHTLQDYPHYELASHA